MVNLENKYPAPRPPLSMFVPAAVFGVLAYICMTHHYFSFVYQYGLTILAGVIMASMYDKELLTQGRLFKGKFPFRKIYAVTGATGGLFVILYAASRFVFHSREMYDFYRAASAVSSMEFFFLIVLLVTPFEEIFFRGYLQLNLMHLAGHLPGYIAATLLYAAVFIFTGSAVLVLYFFLIGLFLGYLYYQFSSILLVSLMRALLTTILVIFPF